MNCFNFTGNIGRDDAVVRHTPSGDSITSFSVAISSGYGEKKTTSWMNCSMFGKRGEAVSAYLKAGTQVAVSGEFTARPYKTKDGQEKISLDVKVNDLTLLGGKQEGKDRPVESYENGLRNPAKPDNAVPQGKSFDNFDDDLPFMRFGFKGAGVDWRAM